MTRIGARGSEQIAVEAIIDDPPAAAPAQRSANEGGSLFESAAAIATAFTARVRSLFDVVSDVLQRHPAVVAAVVIGTMPLAQPAQGAPLGDTTRAGKPAAVARQHTQGFKVVVDRHAKGAYFRKITSGAATAHRGIRGEGVLPMVSFDAGRHYLSPAGPDEYRTGPLDRPSIYLGGRAAGRELDAGLTWDRVFDGDGHATYTDAADGTDGRRAEHRFIRDGDVVRDGNGTVVARGDEVADFMKQLRPNFAFRPYWRTTNGDNDDWHQPKVGSAQNIYFYPGENFTMSVRVTGKDLLQLEIGDFSTQVRQLGFGRGHAQSFKRVNAIDQFYVTAAGERAGRERQNVLPTATQAIGGRWTAVGLISGRSEIPLTGNRFTEVHGADTHANYRSIFRITGTNARGGETIDITAPHARSIARSSSYPES